MLKKIYSEKKKSGKLLYLKLAGKIIGFFPFEEIEIDDGYVMFLNEKDIAVFYTEIKNFKHNLEANFNLKKDDELNEWFYSFTGNYELKIKG